MKQITVWIPGRVPHRIPEGELEKFLSRYPQARHESAEVSTNTRHGSAEVPVTKRHESAEAPIAERPLHPPLSRMKKMELQNLLVSGYAFTPPRKWTRAKLIKEIEVREAAREEPTGQVN